MRLARSRLKCTLNVHPGPRGFASTPPPLKKEPSVEDRLSALESSLARMELALSERTAREKNEKNEKDEKEPPPSATPLPWFIGLQALFFGGTTVLSVINLAYATIREGRAQHVSALREAFEVMEDDSVAILRRLLSRQPVLGYFEKVRRNERRVGGYQLPDDLDRIDAALSLHQRVKLDGQLQSAWVTIAGERYAEVLMPAQDDVRETILRALTKLSHFHHLTLSGTLTIEHLPEEMVVELEMLAGVDKFEPKTPEDEMFLASLHDFIQRRRQAKPFFQLMESIAPNWKPIQWEQKHDDLLVELYKQRASKSDFLRLAGINDEEFA